MDWGINKGAAKSTAPSRGLVPPGAYGTAIPAPPARAVFRRQRSEGLPPIADTSDDLLLAISSFLETRDVLRLSQTASRFRDFGRQPQLWEDFLGRDFVVQRPKSTSTRVLDAMRNAASRMSMRMLPTAATAPRDGTPQRASGIRPALDRYRQLYQERLARLRVQKQRVRDRAEQAAAVIPQRRWRVVLDLVQYVCGLGLPMWYPFIFFCLLLSKMNGGDVGWMHVFAPLFALLIHPWVFGLVGAINDTCAYVCGRHNMFDNQTEGDRYNIVHWWSRYAKMTKEVCERSFCKKVGCCMRGFIAVVIILATVATVACIVAKLNGSLEVSWPVALIPAYILTGVGVCCPCAGWLAACFTDEDDLDDEGNEDACIRDLGMSAGASGIAIFVIPVLIMLALRLGGNNNLTFVYIFIPFWIFNGCMCMGGCGGVCGGVIAGDNMRERCAIFFSSCCGMLFMFLPLISQIFLALADAGRGTGSIGGDATRIIAPLIAFFGMLALAACGFAFAAWHRARDERMEEVYDMSGAHWRCCVDVESGLPAGDAAGAPPILANPLRQRNGDDD